MNMDVREMEKVFKALANRRRLAILFHLKKRKEASVGVIAEAIKLSFKATSRHLSVLSHAGLIEKDQRSLEVYCKISPHARPCMKHISSIL